MAEYTSANDNPQVQQPPTKRRRVAVGRETAGSDLDRPHHRSASEGTIAGTIAGSPGSEDAAVMYHDGLGSSAPSDCGGNRQSRAASTPDAFIGSTICFVNRCQSFDEESWESISDGGEEAPGTERDGCRCGEGSLGFAEESARMALTRAVAGPLSEMIVNSLSSAVMYRVVPLTPADGFVREECSFNFLLQKHPLLSRCYVFTGAAHRSNGPGGTVGYIEGKLIDRPTDSFYSSAAELGVGMQDLAWTLCDSDGRVARFDHREIHRASPHVHQGGFLHIQQVQVHPDHRRMDLGLWMIHQALSLLRKMWTIAVMEASPLDDVFAASVTDEISDDESGGMAERLRLASASRSLGTHFARMGFAQAGGTPELSQVLFLTPRMYFPRDIESEDALLRWKSKSEVGRSEISDPPVQHVRVGLDKEFAETSSKFYVNSSDRVRDLKALIERGASIHGSRAMFDAAANESSMGPERLKELVELGGDVNAQDECGNTPLHIAASFLCAEAVKYLLQQGASRDAKNDEGETAKMAWDTYALKPCQLDFMVGMGLEIPSDDVRAEISLLLRENQGKT